MTLGRPGDLLAARYRLDHFIGTAGTAQTGVAEHWQAYDERLARPVTVRLTEAADEAARAGSVEAALAGLAGLNHPGVAAVYDVGVTDEIGAFPVAYAVSEWTEGRTLGQIMAGGPQPWPRTADWGRQIAGALAALHSIGIAHGTLGPNSVAIHDDRQVKILDAGLDPDAGRTAQPPAQARPYYSPEQTMPLDLTNVAGPVFEDTSTVMLGRSAPLPAGAPDDVYALGALVWQATVAAPPRFGVDGVYGPDRSPLLEAGAPPELAALLAELLDADPARRPTAAAAHRRFGPFAAVERVADSVPATAPMAAVAATQLLGAPMGGTGLGVRVTDDGTPAVPSRSAARAAAAEEEARRRRRRGLLIGLVLLLAAVGAIVGVVLAMHGTSNTPGPVTTPTNTATTAPTTAAVTLPSGVTSSAAPQSSSAAPATSSAPPTSSTPSQSPSSSPPSTPASSPATSASSGTTSNAGGNGTPSPPTSTATKQ